MEKNFFQDTAFIKYCDRIYYENGQYKIMINDKHGNACILHFFLPLHIKSMADKLIQCGKALQKTYVQLKTKKNLQHTEFGI